MHAWTCGNWQCAKAEPPKRNETKQHKVQSTNTNTNTNTTMVSSGTLPLSTYHRAQSLGAGSYGSVITVYDDDGNEFALKLFEEDEEDEDDADADADADVGMSLGALREISVLRFFRLGNAHPNIIEIHDVQTADFDEDEGEAGGAGTDGYLAMAMPLFPAGSLTDSFSKITTKQQKVAIAHGILSAVAHLHENSIIHRDIKSDNIVLESQSAENDNHHSLFRPVLIDFSLAKLMDPRVVIPGGGTNNTTTIQKNTPNHSASASASNSASYETTHTPSIGTPTYRAPEVIQQQDYGLPSDMWSVGVVLLELLRGTCLEATKDQNALKLISETLETLPHDQPFPNLIRSLLEPNPDKRWTARQTLDAPLFAKFGHFVDPQTTFRILNLNEALPFDDDDHDHDHDDDVSFDDKENGANDQKEKKKNAAKNNTQKQPKVDPVLAKRMKTIQQICHSMDWKNPLTAQAALSYSIQISQLEDNIDDLKESQALLDCIVLAHKFCERHLTNLHELPSEGGPRFRNWDVDQYVDNESTLFMMMDFCLYPRQFLLL